MLRDVDSRAVVDAEWNKRSFYEWRQSDANGADENKEEADGLMKARRKPIHPNKRKERRGGEKKEEATRLIKSTRLPKA